MEDELGSANEAKFFEIVKKPITRSRYSIYIKDSIQESKDMATLLGVFRNASASDEVFVYLNSSGGWLNTAQQVLNAMKDCQAKITTIADGRVASAATLIFMAGDSRVINDNAHFMFHNYSSGASGKGHELKQKITFQDKYYTDLLHRYYHEVFTKDEIKEIIDGKDVYVSGKDFEKKLNKVKNEEKKNESSSRTSKKSSRRSS
jgi:ATP-dependent protease ClpP protease subunit